MAATGQAVIDIDPTLGAEIKLSVTASLADVFNAISNKSGEVVTLPIGNVPGWEVQVSLTPEATPVPSPALVPEG
jgi:hypothetical protein